MIIAHSLPDDLLQLLVQQLHLYQDVFRVTVPLPYLDIESLRLALLLHERALQTAILGCLLRFLKSRSFFNSEK